MSLQLYCSPVFCFFQTPSAKFSSLSSSTQCQSPMSLQLYPSPVSRVSPAPFYPGILSFSSFALAQSLCLSNVTQSRQSLVFLQLRPGTVSVPLKCDPSPSIFVFLQLHPGPVSVSLKCDPSPPISCVSPASPWASLSVSSTFP